MVKNEGLKAVQLIQCAECGGVVGVVENVDFNKKFDVIIKNQQALERVINIKEINIIGEVKKLKEKEQQSLELIETIYSVLYKHGIK